MEPQEVGIRELKAHMGDYLRRVRDGETLVVTDRGKRICRVVPERTDSERRIRELVEAGLLYWSGQKLVPPTARVKLKGPKTLSDIVLENRD